MHDDKLTIKSTGRIHLDIDMYLNSTLAATLAGATFSGTVTVTGPKATLSLDIIPGAPLTLQQDIVDTKGGHIRSE